MENEADKKERHEVLERCVLGIANDSETCIIGMWLTDQYEIVTTTKIAFDGAKILIERKTGKNHATENSNLQSSVVQVTVIKSHHLAIPMYQEVTLRIIIIACF